MDNLIKLVNKAENTTLSNYELQHLLKEQNNILNSLNDNFNLEKTVKNRVNYLKELKNNIFVDDINKLNQKKTNTSTLKDKVNKIIKDEISVNIKQKEKELQDKYEEEKFQFILKQDANKLDKVVKEDIEEIKSKKLPTLEKPKDLPNTALTLDKSKSKKKTTLKDSKKMKTKKKLKKFLIVNNNPPVREYYFFQKK